MLEVLGGVALVRVTAYFMGQYFGGGVEYWMWIALGILAAVLFIAMVITVLTVKEPPSTYTTGLSKSVFRQRIKIDLEVSRNFGWFLLARGLLGITGVALQIYTLYYLMDVVKIPNPASVAGDLIVVSSSIASPDGLVGSGQRNPPGCPHWGCAQGSTLAGYAG